MKVESLNQKGLSNLFFFQLLRMETQLTLSTERWG